MAVLENKVAIVTGGTRGVGKGVAKAFVKAGAKVLIVDRKLALGRATEEELRPYGEVIFKAVDFSDRKSLPGIVDDSLRHFGRLDTLVNAAQASQQLTIENMTIEAMNLALETGLWPTLLLMQAALPYLRKTCGSVINIASGAGLTGTTSQGSYAAAKEAIGAISKAAAHEWGPDGIRVNVICPLANSPGIETWKQAFPNDYELQLSRVPMRRIGDCETDIGATAVFLASDAAGYITGQTLMVDGGQTMLA